MGATVLGAAILGGSALLGTGATIAMNKSNQSYGSDQSAASRAWGTNERIAAQQYNTRERLATQEYNNPANQAMMMRAGGLNPSAISQGVRFVGSTPQSSVAGSAGGISPMGSNQVPNIPQLISSGSDLVNALAKHKETAASMPLIGEQVKYYVQKTYGQQLSNDLLEIEKEFKNSTLPDSIKKVHEEVAKLEFEKIAVEKQGKVFEQEAKLKEAQQRLADMQTKLTGEQAIQSHYLTDNWHRITESMLQLQKSQTFANYAQGNASRASSEQTKFFTTLYKEPAVREALSNQIQRAAENALKDGAIKEEQANLISWQAAQMEKATNNYEIQMWSNIINQTINTAANAVGEFTKFGLVKQFLQPKGSFDPNAGRGFTINQENGLLFRNGM